MEGIKLKRSFVVSLIGRPNVGKSTIFNRLMGNATKAITYNEPGVTRDRHYGIAHIEELGQSNEIILVDTGGFYTDNIREEDIETRSKFFNLMRSHADIAIRESDLVLMVVDVREGLLPLDSEIATFIRARKKEFWLILNKYDGNNQQGLESEFYKLGVDKVLFVSAAHGVGFLDLKEELQRKISNFEVTPDTMPVLQKGITPRENVVSKVAIIGAPNSGKSTLLNNLLGSDRALVSEIAGTTVDPVEGYFDLFFGEEVVELKEKNEFTPNKTIFSQYESFKKNNPDVYRKVEESYQSLDDIKFEDDEEELESEELVEENVGSFWRSVQIIDTAGIRKMSSVDGVIESQSVYRSLKCITESEIVIFMLDATKGMGHQDRRLIGIALEKGKSVIVCLNKIDLLKDEMKDEKTKKAWMENLLKSAPWLSYCDIIPISAKTGKYIGQLKESLKKTIKIRSLKIPTGELNRTILRFLEERPLTASKSNGVRVRVKYSSMVKSSPPTFLLFVNRSKGIPDHYRRYLQNSLRKEFNLFNSPVHLIFRAGSDLEKKSKGQVKTHK